jgi:hypothetical protein
MDSNATFTDLVEVDHITSEHRRNCRRHGVVAINLSTGPHVCRTGDRGWFVNQRRGDDGGGYYPEWWRCPTGCNVVD